jgi:hypothetical protein
MQIQIPFSVRKPHPMRRRSFRSSHSSHSSHSSQASLQRKTAVMALFAALGVASASRADADVYVDKI